MSKSKTNSQSDQQKLKKKIRDTFVEAGFSEIPTNGKEFILTTRKIEIDSLYIYENIWLICEDTTTESRHKADHLRNKKEAADEIRNNEKRFIEIIREKFSDQQNVNKYETARIRMYFLYFSTSTMDAQEQRRYKPLIIIVPSVLEYLFSVSNTIKCTARNEIFRFLGIQDKDIGEYKSASSDARIDAPIIYPGVFSGMENIHVVSFMMSAEDLMNYAYVLRNDSWEKELQSYQRLLIPEKIKRIREYLCNNTRSFLNNIIVSLPDETAFYDTDNKKFICVNELKDESIKQHLQLSIPRKINSICIIDGQHRIFAHYESNKNDDEEAKIATLRGKRHLLVTGLIFDKNISKEQRLKVESQLFLDINTTSTPVPSQLLLQIGEIISPENDESISLRILTLLNNTGAFKGELQIYQLDKTARLKTASIVKFALKYLITTKPSSKNVNLYTLWSEETGRDANATFTLNDVEQYSEYCFGALNQYFNAVKEVYKEEWNSKNSKIVSVISINSFILAFNHQLKQNGLKDYNYYYSCFNKHKFDFSRENFKYTSSQYRKFSKVILKECFGIIE